MRAAPSKSAPKAQLGPAIAVAKVPVAGKLNTHSLPTMRARRAHKAGLEPLEGLAAELYGVVGAALSAYGLPAEAQQRLFAESLGGREVARKSSVLLDRFRRLADLVSTWHAESSYLDAAGKPKVLKLRGEGATFETLARAHLPELKLEQAVELACQSACVGRRGGDRIASFGDVTVDLSPVRLVTLAQAIGHIRQIVDTFLHNIDIPSGDKRRRIERMVHGILDVGDFAQFHQTVRPQIHDLCERVDGILKTSAKRRPPAGARGTAGIGVYVYFDEPPPAEALSKLAP